MKRVILPIILLLASALTLSAQAPKPANCYIVAPGASFEFNGRLQGCSNDTIEGTPTEAGLLWESAGADNKVKEGDVVASVSFSSETGMISVKAGQTPGNALVVIEDSMGNVLWSWHIWVTDYDPEKGSYLQNAKGVVMMDRNLGALSTTPGDPLALGLFYQWGRKDPFPGPVAIDGKKEARNTYRWPKPATSDSYYGTTEYVRYNPATFVLWSDDNCDWLYTGRPESDNTRWAAEKTKYDPCPAGWKVPEAGNVLGADPKWDASARGMVSFDLSDPSHKIWTPATGFRSGIDGTFGGVGLYGYYWSSAPVNCLARSQYFDGEGTINNGFGAYRGTARAVRCVKE
ncbi:MAG: hypothetical protein IKX03_02195 [Bacteroidales bacterium]|nr:hypothetical protein [Bacteroidales bacterium]